MGRGLMRRRASDEQAPGNIVEAVMRMAVLLQAGATPRAAWQHLADAGDPSAGRIVLALAGGSQLVTAIADAGPDPSLSGASLARERAAWTDFAAVWEVAIAVGAPLADALRGMASALRDAGELLDDITVALAEPAGTGRLMAWLPGFGLLVGVALGFDTIRVLATTPIGIGLTVCGLSLMLAARAWSARLVRRAEPAAGTPGAAAELTAVALAGGVSIPRAVQIVDNAPGGPRSSADRDRVLDLSRRAGIPAVELLRAEARHERHLARVDGRMRVAKLSTGLLLPLGACTLPAFLCLGVAPLMLSIITDTPLPL